MTNNNPAQRSIRPALRTSLLDTWEIVKRMKLSLLQFHIVDGNVHEFYSLYGEKKAFYLTGDCALCGGLISHLGPDIVSLVRAWYCRSHMFGDALTVVVVKLIWDWLAKESVVFTPITNNTKSHASDLTRLQKYCHVLAKHRYAMRTCFFYMCESSTLASHTSYIVLFT